jgi:hypothetical protein
MNDRLRKFMEALSVLAKQSDEPETQLTMQARISDYFAGAVDRQAALESLRKAALAKAEADPDEHEFWDDVVAPASARRAGSGVAARAFAIGQETSHQGGA